MNFSGSIRQAAKILYTRPRFSTFSEVTSSPSFFLSAPDIAPRTVCDCQPVAVMISAMVAPSGARNMAMRVACLVSESGEFKRGTLGESKESYKVKTYGRVVAITRQTLINDDLDAFTRIPAMYGNSIAQPESDVVWGIITANPAMADGNALFHTTHKNLAGTSGDGLLVGSIFGIAAGGAALGESVETALVGVFDITKVGSQAWTAGAKVYWDNTNKEATKTATANTLIGVATEAIAGGAGDLIGRVRLNASV